MRTVDRFFETKFDHKNTYMKRPDNTYMKRPDLIDSSQTQSPNITRKSGVRLVT